MKINKQYIKVFPEPSDVFATEIEKHAHFFLPIISIDMSHFQPEKYQSPFWLHVVQPTEIYDGHVGEDTEDWHDKYNKLDQMCFDVNEDGKYTFSGNWKYFESSHKYNPQSYKKAEKFALKSGKKIEECLQIIKASTPERLKGIIKSNHLYYKLIKTFYQQNQRMPATSYKFTCYFDKAIENNTPFTDLFTQFVKADICEYHDKQDVIMDDIAGLSKSSKEWLAEESLSSMDELLNKYKSLGNLHDLPCNEYGQVFSYIGLLTGFRFQRYGCDELNTFYDHKLKKAVICLVYS